MFGRVAMGDVSGDGKDDVVVGVRSEDVGSNIDQGRVYAFMSAPAKGDVDCNGDINVVDALKELRNVAGLAVSQNEPCPDIGTEVASIFGDMDCDGDADARDALLILRHVVGLTVDLPSGCFPIGT